MIFREKTYSVLLASSDEKLNNAVRSALAVNEYWPVLTASNGGEARRMASDRDFDIVLVNDPLSDEPAVSLAEDLSLSGSGVTALLMRRESADDAYFRSVERGVFTIPKPLSPAVFAQAMRMLCAAREKLLLSERRQESVEDRMAQIRLVNRAKWLLIEREGLTEPQAHRHLEKMAMDSRRSKEEVARELIGKLGS